jgi:hypothetical protein
MSRFPSTLHSLHSGDVMANDQTSVTRVADRRELSLLLQVRPLNRESSIGLAPTPRHSEAATRGRYRSCRVAIRDSRIATFDWSRRQSLTLQAAPMPGKRRMATWLQRSVGTAHSTSLDFGVVSRTGSLAATGLALTLRANRAAIRDSRIATFDWWTLALPR